MSQSISQKKQNRSPFAIFMMKMKGKPQLRGLPNNQFIKQCDDIYIKLSPEVKNQFKRLSLLAKSSDLNDYEFTEQLNKLSLEDNEEWDDHNKTTNKLLVIGSNSSEEEEEDTFEILEEVLENTKNVEKQTIVCICFNILVHTFEDEYYPNEIGLIKFTLENGIQDFFTKLIPNCPPNGYYGRAKEFSESYHKIPVNSSDEFLLKTNVPKLFEEIYDFMSTSDLKDKRNRKLICCKTEERDDTHRYQVVGCLQWFDQQIKTLKVENKRSLTKDFKIVELSDLLFLISRKYCEIPRPKPICEDSLIRSKFDYYPNLRCDFHEPSENNYCSLAIAKRQTYLFFDFVFSQGQSLKLDIKPKASHIPSKTDESLNTENKIVSNKNVVKTRPQIKIKSSQNEESIDLTELHENEISAQKLKHSLKIGVGRGRKVPTFKN